MRSALIMNNTTTQNLLNSAGDKCKGNGTKLTAKRKLVLQQLIESDQLLSAYDIAARIKNNTDSHMPAMSVYRILDFLESVNLAHKLESQNKYLACRHIACQHSHESPQFLICQNCLKVKEVDISKSIIDEIAEVADNDDFKLINPTLEIKGICQDCQTKPN